MIGIFMKWGRLDLAHIKHEQHMKIEVMLPQTIELPETRRQA